MLVTVTAGVFKTLPSSLTLPSTIQRSASRREQIPARAITLAMRSPFLLMDPEVLISLFASGIVKSHEDLNIVGIYLKLWVPLHSKAEPLLGRFYPLDNTVRCHRIHNGQVGDNGNSLVMG